MVGAGKAIWDLRLGGHMLGEGVLKEIMSWMRFLRFVTLSGLSETCKIGMHLRVHEIMI